MKKDEINNNVFESNVSFNTSNHNTTVSTLGVLLLTVFKVKSNNSKKLNTTLLAQKLIFYTNIKNKIRNYIYDSIFSALFISTVSH